MNDSERELLRLVCDGDIRKAQLQARIILNGICAKKDESFKQNNLRKLDAKGPSLIELPHNLRELLVAEDVTEFPEERFVLRDNERTAVKKYCLYTGYLQNWQKWVFHICLRYYYTARAVAGKPC